MMQFLSIAATRMCKGKPGFGWFLGKGYAHLQAEVPTCPLAATAARLRLHRAFPFCCSQPASQ
jgi:hypothetical protein